jgi:hypothetical protein
MEEEVSRDGGGHSTTDQDGPCTEVTMENKTAWPGLPVEGVLAGGNDGRKVGTGIHGAAVGVRSGGCWRSGQ